MKIGDKVYQVVSEPSTHLVLMSVQVWGITMAMEEITPDQARALAQLLKDAADQAEPRRS